MVGTSVKYSSRSTLRIIIYLYLYIIMIANKENQSITIGNYILTHSKFGEDGSLIDGNLYRLIGKGNIYQYIASDNTIIGDGSKAKSSFQNMIDPTDKYRIVQPVKIDTNYNKHIAIIEKLPQPGRRSKFKPNQEEVGIMTVERKNINNLSYKKLGENLRTHKDSPKVEPQNVDTDEDLIPEDTNQDTPRSNEFGLYYPRAITITVQGKQYDIIQIEVDNEWVIKPNSYSQYIWPKFEGELNETSAIHYINKSDPYNSDENNYKFNCDGNQIHLNKSLVTKSVGRQI